MNSYGKDADFFWLIDTGFFADYADFMKKIFFIPLLILLAFSPVFSQGSVHGMKVSVPNGAPAICVASIAEKNPDDFTFVSSETISACLANARDDFIIAPVNAGAKIYRSGKSSYKLAAVVTWGNLYFASQRKNFTLADIKKYGVTLFGENTINASVALFALEKNGAAPKKVEYLAGASNTQALLLSDKNAIVLTAEPALSAAKMKNPQIKSFSLNELFKNATGFDGYAQAGLFVKVETAKNHPDEVRAFIDEVKKSCGLCKTDVALVAKICAELQIFPNAKVAEKAIPSCAVRFVSALDAKKMVESTAKIDLKQFGGSIPENDFYFSF